MQKNNKNNKLAAEVNIFYKNLILRYGIEEVQNNSELFPLILLPWKSDIKTDGAISSISRYHFKSGSPSITIYEHLNKYFLRCGNFSNINHLNGLELLCTSFSEAQKYVDRKLLKQKCILIN